jgi:hypothetical protein
MVSDPSVEMSVNHPNNERLRELYQASKLKQAVAMTLFNRYRRQRITETEWKSWLADPGTVRWRAMPDECIAHAEKVFANV